MYDTPCVLGKTSQRLGAFIRITFVVEDSIVSKRPKQSSYTCNESHD